MRWDSLIEEQNRAGGREDAENPGDPAAEAGNQRTRARETEDLPATPVSSREEKTAEKVWLPR